MRDFARQDQLLFEAAKNFGMAGELGTYQFERDQALEFGVARLVDRAHAALAEQLKNFEAFGEKSSGFKLPFRGSFAGRPRRDRDGPRLGAANGGAHRRAAKWSCRPMAAECCTSCSGPR